MSWDIRSHEGRETVILRDDGVEVDYEYNPHTISAMMNMRPGAFGPVVGYGHEGHLCSSWTQASLLPKLSSIATSTIMLRSTPPRTINERQWRLLKPI